MQKLFILIIILISSLFCVSCKDLSSSEEISEDRIMTILEEFPQKFNDYKFEEILANFSDDYLHNGLYKNRVMYHWQERRSLYDSMTITDLSVVLDGNKATASFKMKFANNTTFDLYNEPEDLGEISYFVNENGEWKIIGNQLITDEITGYNLHVNSNPPGAYIYLNDLPLFQVTQATLYSIPAGQYKLRLYKYGYNEWETTVTIPDTVYINKQLSQPTYPKPEFQIIAPVNNYHFNTSIINLTATLRNTNSAGQTVNFDGTSYIINVNSKETKAVFLTETINQTINLNKGANTIILRATNASGNTGWSERIIVYGDYE